MIQTNGRTCGVVDSFCRALTDSATASRCAPSEATFPPPAFPFARSTTASALSGRRRDLPCLNGPTRGQSPTTGHVVRSGATHVRLAR